LSVDGGLHVLTLWTLATRTTLATWTTATLTSAEAATLTHALATLLLSFLVSCILLLSQNLLQGCCGSFLLLLHVFAVELWAFTLFLSLLHASLLFLSLLQEEVIDLLVLFVRNFGSFLDLVCTASCLIFWFHLATLSLSAAELCE